MKEIEYDLADVIIGRPHGFTVGRKHFYLYPITLAKMFLLKRQIEQIGVNEEQLRQNPYLETLRVVKAHREECCHIIAYHATPNTQKDLFCTRNITIRKNYFAEELTDEELSSLMIIVLTADKTEKFMEHLGLKEEHEKMQGVLKIKQKHDKSTLSFNGKSILGTFIGQLKEMGYSDNEILYEKGYVYLRLMLADKVVTINLTEEERNEVPPMLLPDYMDAGDAKNAQAIIAELNSRGIKVEQ